MHCPQCQHENPDGSRFCNACGAKLDMKNKQGRTPMDIALGVGGGGPGAPGGPGARGARGGGPGGSNLATATILREFLR